MSVISEFHAIEEFDSKSSRPLDGQVLIVARGNAKSGTKSICASLPPTTAESVLDDFDAIAPHIVEYVDSIRAKILRKLANTGAKEVRTEEVSVAGIAAWLAAESEESGRLSKEVITEYLGAEENKEALRAAFALALGYHNDVLTTEQENKITQLHKGFSDVVSELSGTRTVWEEKKQNTARKYLDCLDDSVMKDRLLGKLVEMAERNKKQGDVMEALGF